MLSPNEAEHLPGPANPVIELPRILAYCPKELHCGKDLGYISCEAFADFEWANFSVICRV